MFHFNIPPHLFSNQIGPEGGIALAAAIKANSVLGVLDVSSTLMGG
jgi:hypothetical protein